MNTRQVPTWHSIGFSCLVSLIAGCSASDSATPAIRVFGAAGGSLSLGAGGTSPTEGVGTTGGEAATGGTNSADSGPITQVQSNSWNWVPVAEAHCRDGTSTGIGINPNPASDKLVILLEGGGACFDVTTCGLNAAHFDKKEFDKFTADAQYGGGAGVFNRGDVANPVKDWNFVFVPYCTGDVHAGNNPQGFVIDKGPQQFVGYANLGLYLKRIAPTFPNLTQVLLTGVSAGGFGALANYVQVARAFDPVPITLLDDSGPPMGPPYVPACLANQYVENWKLSQTVLVDCGSDCADTSQLLLSFQKHVARSYPSQSFALMDSAGDWVISAFFGFGSNDCAQFAVLSEATFTAGLLDIRAQMAEFSNFGTFLFPGNTHTTLLDAPRFDGLTAGNTKLTDYMTSLLAGQVANAGP